MTSCETNAGESGIPEWSRENGGTRQRQGRLTSEKEVPKTETHPHVIIVAAPNGAGKSTTAPLLLRDTFAVEEFVNADAIAYGLSAFAPEKAALEAGKIMLRRLRDLAAKRVMLGGHAIDEATIRRRYTSGLHNLFSLYMPVVSSWEIYDNSAPGKPMVIAACDNGIMTFANELKFTELKEARR